MSAVSATVRTPTHNATQAPSTLRVWMYGVFLAAAVAAYGYIPPADNTVNAGWNTWKPVAGYVWLNATQARQGVVWQPGLAHPSVHHLRSATQEKHWTPELGYDWIGSTLEEGVRWEPGQRNSAYPHAAAASGEGQWQPDPGYVLSKPGQLSAALWQPGLEHRDFKNVLAAAKEGTWAPRPEFRLETPSTLSQAIWAPGSAHPDFPNILADEKANQWKPAAGYAWVNQTTGDLRVAAVQPAEAANSETNSGPQESRATRFAIGFIKAILGDGLAKPSSDDGMIARNVGRPIAEALRNSGFRDMAQALGGR